MNNQCYKVYRIYVISAGILALISGIILTMFNYFFYDFNLTLYAHGAPVFAIYTIFISTILFFFTSFFTLKTDLLPLVYPKRNQRLCSVFLLLCALTLCATVLFGLLGSSKDRLITLFHTENLMLAAASALIKISLVLAVPAAAYFFVSFISDKVMPVFSMFAGAWALVYMMRVYFDMSTVVMDPLRMLTTASAAAVALFMVVETRVGMERPSPRAYVFAGLCAAFICFVSGFSKVAAIFLRERAIEVQTTYDLFELFFGVYAFSRLWAFMKYENFAQLKTPGAQPQKDSDVTSQKSASKVGVEQKEAEAALTFNFEQIKIGKENADKPENAELSDNGNKVFSIESAKKDISKDKKPPEGIETLVDFDTPKGEQTEDKTSPEE